LLFADGKLQAIDAGKCAGCMKCVDACPADAIKQWGKTMSVEDVMREIRMDMGYYRRSGGGVTVSGGEPLLQADFVAELFQACKKEGIHTCCESALSLPWEEVEKVLPWTDLLITDIKHMDSEIHRGFSGVGNERILENQKRIIKENRELVIRIPVIPGVNDDYDNIEQTADFILQDLEGKVRTLQLLSFMRLGEEKYQSLGRPYAMKDVEVDRQAFQTQVEKIAAYFNGRGIHCAVGAKEW
jgi:pyruvate formate lyase activating enzyme